MSSTPSAPSLAAAQRLPGRAVLLLIVLSGVGFVSSIAWYASLQPANERVPLSTYFEPAMLLSFAESWITSALLLCLLAWSAMRSYVERRGAAAVRPTAALVAFAVLYVLLNTAGAYLERQIGPVVYGHLSHALMMNSNLMFAPPQLATGIESLVMNTWLTLDSAVIVLAAAWLALRLTAPRSARGTASSSHPWGRPGTRTVPVLCALFVMAIEWTLQYASQQTLATYRDANLTLLTIGFVVGPIMTFALAYLGAKLGAGQPESMRPFRALSASMLAFVVKFSAMLAIGLLWGIVYASLSSGHDLGQAAAMSLVGLLLFAWLILSVVLMRWFAAILYNHFQRPVAAAAATM